MQTECCECDKTAVAFWGDDPYCRKHLDIARAKNQGHKTCADCYRWNDCVPCGCGNNICETCYDDKHQAHGLAP